MKKLTALFLCFLIIRFSFTSSMLNNTPEGDFTYNAALTGAVMMAVFLRFFAKKVTALRSPR